MTQSGHSHSGILFDIRLVERGNRPETLCCTPVKLHVDLMLVAVTNDGQLEPTAATANDRYVPIMDMA